VPDKRDAAADPAVAAEALGLYAAIPALPDEFRDALVAIDVVGRPTPWPPEPHACVRGPSPAAYPEPAAVSPA
jgi:hypothetical protein